MTSVMGQMIATVNSLVAATGLFDAVSGHEPELPPGSGVTAACWPETIGPALANGLATTSPVVMLHVRVYRRHGEGQMDAIEVVMVDAVDAVMRAITGAYTLGGTARAVDLLGGETGQKMTSEAGWMNADGTLYRIHTITVPVVLNDQWEQVP